MSSYDFGRIESKWQARWEQEGTFRSHGPGEPGFDQAKPKYYILDMFPYPSGAGLHVGHPEGYTATDIVARYKRMRGFNVLHPMGWDAFGLPAEEYARETNQHPEISVRTNIDTFRRQIRALGFSYDWVRELSTADPDYYKWTQWIFLKIWNSWFDPQQRRARPISELRVPPEMSSDPVKVLEFLNGHRLAYQAEAPVWWCPRLGTVMANEEVNREGKTTDKGYPCERVRLRQWLFRITAFADRLLGGLDSIDWPAGIKKMQRDWIGRSEGAEIEFRVACAEAGASAMPIVVFTTRPDTLFGATYVVLAPEHPLVDLIATASRKNEVADYCSKATQRTELERISETREKTGVDTGAVAINPVNGERVPIWIADYVLMSYGTGAIMAVPAHDQRDFEFALKFSLPLKIVVRPSTEELKQPLTAAFEGDGIAVNSPRIEGLRTAEAKNRVIDDLESRKVGRRRTMYKLRDWLFSRQRYWGEPFPLLFTENGDVRAVPDCDLPVVLPHMRDYVNPPGSREAPLSRAKEWVATRDPETGLRARRETDTMPGWAGSCWYYLRFTDPHCSSAPWSQSAERYWMPVDLYIGGAEHAVLHLLYARFWHHVLYDLGHVSTPEPFHKLFNQGLILSYVATDIETEAKVPWDQIVQTHTMEKDGKNRWIDEHTSKEVNVKIGKMSKSLRNVVNPEDVIREYGADTLRLYEMFMGPLQNSKPWRTSDVQGPHRFLHRTFDLIVDEKGDLREHLRVERAVDPVLERALQRMIKAVTEDIETLQFNTAIAWMMGFLNAAEANKSSLTRSQARRLVLVVSPFAPHLGEELWEILGGSSSLSKEPWPSFDASVTWDEHVDCAVLVDGRIRAHMPVAVNGLSHEIESGARIAAATWLREGEWKCRVARSAKGMIVSFFPL